jgi:membrane protein DedA with SNARE-associated domain
LHPISRVDDAVLQGSLVFVFAWLALGGLGAPLPEDAALLSTGVLIQRGTVPAALGLAVVLVGVLGGDALLFFAARKLGPRAYERRMFQRILPPARRAKIEGAYRRFGGRLVFVARHVGGLRAATFAMAGITGMRPLRFLAWDAAAAALSVPLMVGVGYYGATHVERMRKGVAHVQHYIAFAAILVVVGAFVWHQIRSLRAMESGGEPRE